MVSDMDGYDLEINGGQRFKSVLKGDKRSELDKYAEKNLHKVC